MKTEKETQLNSIQQIKKNQPQNNEITQTNEQLQTKNKTQIEQEQNQTDHYNENSYQPFKPDPKRFQKLFGFPKMDPYTLFSPIPSQVYFQNHFHLNDIYNTSVFHSPVKQTNQSQIVFLCFHGAGSSALTFCQLTKQLKNMKYEVFAYDILGHGQTKNYTNNNQNRLNLSIKTLIDQGLGVYAQLKNLNPKKRFVFIGHSLGGSICCRVAKAILQEQQSNSNLLSVFIIDSIQGTAKQKFKQMEDLYYQFPQQFSCVQSAISWTKRSQLIRRAQSARSSVPSQLIKISTIKNEQSQSELKKQSQKDCYKWKVNMLDTISYWQQWYDGLSKIIVKLPIEKILFTLNKERLDEILREEVERQETGMKVWYFSYSGHFIHQDQYQKCAQIIDDQLKLFKKTFV